MKNSRQFLILLVSIILEHIIISMQNNLTVDTILSKIKGSDGHKSNK